jgi:hypothetical protein
MLGFFTSVRYAASLESLILTREDDTFDPANPSSILKTIAINDIEMAEFDDVADELSLSYRENERLLNIHVPLYERDITPEMREALEL